MFDHVVEGGFDDGDVVGRENVEHTGIQGFGARQCGVEGIGIEHMAFPGLFLDILCDIKGEEAFPDAALALHNQVDFRHFSNSFIVPHCGCFL